MIEVQMIGILKMIRALKKSGMGKNVLRSFRSHVNQQILKYVSDGGELTDWVCCISDALIEPWPLGEKLMCNLDITHKEFPYVRRNILSYLSLIYPDGLYPECFNQIFRPCSVCGKEAICFTNRGELFCSSKCADKVELDKISRMIDTYAPEMSERRRTWVQGLLLRNAMSENWTDEQYIKFIQEYEHK